jgi:hypothetical protein
MAHFLLMGRTMRGYPMFHVSTGDSVYIGRMIEFPDGTCRLFHRTLGGDGEPMDFTSDYASRDAVRNSLARN